MRNRSAFLIQPAGSRCAAFLAGMKTSHRTSRQIKGRRKAAAIQLIKALYPGDCYAF